MSTAGKRDSRLSYVAAFSWSRYGIPYEPLATVDEYTKTQSLHVLDPDVHAILPGIAYLLGLPRNHLDLVELPFQMLERQKRLDLPHNIILAPWPGLRDILLRLAPPNMALCICTDDIFNQILDSELAAQFSLGVIPVSAATPALATKHWIALRQQALDYGRPLLPPPPTGAPLHRIGLEDLRRRVPLGSQIGDLDMASGHLQLHGIISTWAAMEAADVPVDDVWERWSEFHRDVWERVEIPLVFAAPGVPKVWRDATGMDEQPVESYAIDLLASHRGLARGGASYSLESVSNELFHELGLLERQYERSPRSPKKIRRQLRRVGKLAADWILRACSTDTLARSLDILFFSQFPLGLAVIPETTAPLSFARPVCYRPIIPLTRTLQQELIDRPTVYMGDRRLRVLIVECLSMEDRIFPISERIWLGVKNLFKELDVYISHASSLSELRAAVETYPADILILSGHGVAGPADNQRSIRVGAEFYTGNEVSHLPPVVMLSACATGPRGAGTVNVADMMLRYGTFAIVCAAVPVHVSHNGMLFSRLLTNIVQAQDGFGGWRSLLDVFHFTTSSNAVADIIHSFRQYKFSDGIRTDKMQYEFMARRSAGRIRFSHIYDDTLTILREIATDFDVAEAFSAFEHNGGYVPETAFYMILGWPEKIALNAPEYRLAKVGGAVENEEDTP